MEFIELCRKIELPEEILIKMNTVFPQVHFEAINPLLEQLMHIETAPAAYSALCALFPADEGNIKLLICSLECARRQYNVYVKLGIPDRVYINTMKCFSRFVNECKIRNGNYYFDRGWWTYRQISMRIFRIGTLEYELGEYAGKDVIFLHIPSDACFTAEYIDASLEQAAQFIAAHYPAYTDKPILCDSWLLAPALRDLLPSTSNIVRFQDRFEIFKTHPEAMDCLEWVFKVPEGTVFCDLPEKTSLQRNMKQLLLDGRLVGVGYGIMKQPRPRKEHHYGNS